MLKIIHLKIILCIISVNFVSSEYKFTTVFLPVKPKDGLVYITSNPMLYRKQVYKAFNFHSVSNHKDQSRSHERVSSVGRVDNRRFALHSHCWSHLRVCSMYFMQPLLLLVPNVMLRKSPASFR